MNNRKIRILLLDNSPGITGAFLAAYSVAHALQEQFQFQYAVPRQSTVINFLKARNEEVIPFSFLEVQKSYKIIYYVPMLIYNSFRLVKVVKQHQVDVVCVNDIYNMCGVVGKWINPKLKVVYFVRLLPDSYIKQLYRQFAYLVSRNADEVISISNAVRQGLQKMNINSHVIYSHPIKDETHPHKPLVDRNPSVITLLYLANYIPGKGHDYAVNAFAIAKKSVENIRMIMAGGDLGLKKNKEFKQRLIERVRALGLLDNIVFKDFVEDAEELMKSCDIYLNFSESESFSMTCLEALSFGVPTIASDCGGPAEIIEHNKTGILVPNKDLQKMAEAIVLLSRNLELRNRFSKESRDQVRAKFDFNKISGEIATIYRDLFNRSL